MVKILPSQMNWQLALFLLGWSETTQNCRIWMSAFPSYGQPICVRFSGHLPSLEMRCLLSLERLDVRGKDMDETSMLVLALCLAAFKLIEFFFWFWKCAHEQPSAQLSKPPTPSPAPSIAPSVTPSASGVRSMAPSVTPSASIVHSIALSASVALDWGMYLPLHLHWL